MIDRQVNWVGARWKLWGSGLVIAAVFLVLLLWWAETRRNAEVRRQAANAEVCLEIQRDMIEGSFLLLGLGIGAGVAERVQYNTLAERFGCAKVDLKMGAFMR